MPQLDISTYSSQIFWLIVCISLLYSSLVYIFIPRLESSIRARKRKIEALLRDAEMMREESDKIHASYIQEIKQVHSDASEVHKNALVNFEKECQEQMDRFKAEQNELIANFDQELKQMTLDFDDKIEQQSDLLLAQLVEKVAYKHSIKSRGE
ncbi:MAG: hypothetical protein SFT91_03675 [Rickettsiaceae bacterium]|nr:hypothetical protein [Rickettsiaceae bacterium]